MRKTNPHLPHRTKGAQESLYLQNKKRFQPKLKPLIFAEREGFEPPAPLSAAVFKTAVIDHSTISPDDHLWAAFFSKAMQRYGVLRKLANVSATFLHFTLNFIQKYGTKSFLGDKNEYLCHHEEIYHIYYACWLPWFRTRRQTQR